MVEPQASRFWQAAIKSGLMDEAALRAAWDMIPPEKRTLDAIDRRLARQMVNEGRLTLWQAQQILAGRWQGLRIDKYELQDVIGQGGMGRVYLARDSRLKRKVALKILSRERMSNPRAMARFRREAKVGAQLQHENLVRIYDEGDAHSVRYLVMEYIEGKTVGRLIADLGRIPPATAASLAQQVARGLEHLHQKGLLHRDVNPMNILVDHNGVAKLTDLGLAIDLGDMDDIVTRDGATVGTFDYISPEQAKSSRSVDARSDVYSLGCTLYHMIAGRVPFPSPSLPEKLYAHQLSDPDPLASLAPDVPEGLAAVVSKMMQKAVDDRYRRAIDVARALEPFVVGSVSPMEMASTTLSGNAVAPVASAPSAATPPGSDPDLELKPGSATSATAVTPTSDPMDAFKIDLGPETPLSQLRSSSRATSRTKVKPASSSIAGDEPRVRRPIKIPTRAVLSALAGLAGGALILALAFLIWKKLPARSIAGGGRGPTRPATAEERPTSPPVNSPPAEIAIRYPDQSESPQAGLRAAITRLAGRGGEIVLRSKEPIRASDLKNAMSLTGGELIIRAADGARPEIVADLAPGRPWIDAGPLTKLTFVGLSFRTELVADAAKSPDKPTSLIVAHGNVSFDRCTFSTSGADRSIRALSAEGLETKVTNCLFEGFDQAVSLGMFPGASASFMNCLFVRDIGTNPLAGWAIAARRQESNKAASRRLTIDRCTAIGAGLLVADGFTPQAPLSVQVTQSAVRTSALLMTGAKKEELPKSVVWTGKDNAYALTGLAWILLPPTGFESLKDATDLKSWAELMRSDTGGRDDVLKFAGKAQGEGKPLDEFAVMIEEGKPRVGADPSKVGPGGKP